MHAVLLRVLENASEGVLLGIFELNVNDLEQNYHFEVLLLATSALDSWALELYLFEVLEQFLEEKLSESFGQILPAKLIH